MTFKSILTSLGVVGTYGFISFIIGLFLIVIINKLCRNKLEFIIGLIIYFIIGICILYFFSKFYNDIIVIPISIAYFLPFGIAIFIYRLSKKRDEDDYNHLMEEEV